MDSDLPRVEAIARNALGQYGLGPECSLTLLNISENATYRVDDPSATVPSVLRVHRRDYHTRQAIESELDWVAALSEAGLVSTAAVIPTKSGQRIVDAVHPDGEVRQAVLFEWLTGVEPPEDRLVDDFRTLGAITARLHQHSRQWVKPASFTRFTWDMETALGPQGHWGSWTDGMAVGPNEREVLGRAADLMGRRLAAYGSGPDRFGLIHADMRLANLLVDGDQVAVIDFDDCGFSWFMYDLGSSLSFIEDHPLVPELIDSWVQGYRSIAPISAEDEAELETFVMFRRLLLVAWIGSHSATELAQEMGEQFTAVSCDLAETYLSRHG